MHRFGFFPIFLAASFVMLIGVRAQDASDLFLQAYQDFQTAEKLEREGNPREALKKYQVAGRVLASVRSDSPDWQPLVVEYRLKKTQEGIARLEVEVAALPPEVDSIESQLPEPDRRGLGLPTVTSEPVVVTPRNIPRSPRATPQTSDTGSVTAREVRRLRDQLAKANENNRRLEQKLEQKTAEVQMALVAQDRVKVSLVEVKAELAQASAALEDARKDGSVGAERRAEFDKKAEKILADLGQALADKEVLDEENQQLLAKLEQASKYITSSDEIREGLLKEREDLAEAAKRAAEGKADPAALKKLTSEKKELQSKLAEAEKLVKAKTTEAEKLAAEVAKKAEQDEKDDAAMKKLASENKELQSQLTEAEKLAKAKTADAEKLLVETKRLTGKLAEALINTPSQASIDRMVAQKNILLAKVAKLEKSQKEPSGENPEKDRIIASLQSDLNTANDRLLEAQSQISRSDDKLRDLRKQLDETSGELAQMKINPAPSKEESNLMAENELLRGIILRQIKEQARRDEAKKEIELVVASTPTKLDSIRPFLRVLGEPILQLTPEETNLFKEPVSLLTQPDGDESLSVTMAVQKPTADEAEANKAAQASSEGEALPAEARERFNQAQELFEVGDFAGAEQIFQDIVETIPNNYYILSNLGAVQIESGKLSAAEVALKKAVQIKSDDSYAHRNLGIVYSRQGKIDDAIVALRRSVAANKDDSVAHNYLGVCLGQKEKRADAELEFKQAIAIQPDYAAAHFNLAVLYATSQPPSLKLAKIHYVKATEYGAPPDASLERLIQ